MDDVTRELQHDDEEARAFETWIGIATPEQLYAGAKIALELAVNRQRDAVAA
jgi:hypothetical protein